MFNDDNNSGNLFGINVHLYPSDFLHESRIEKISIALRDLGIFSQIWLIGVAGCNLAEKEEVDFGVTLYRVGVPTNEHSFIKKIVSFIRYYIAVIKLLNSSRVGCINAHSLSVLPLAVFIKLIKRCRLVYDTHELETETNSLKGSRKYFAKVVERIFINSVDAVFCVSQRISRWYSSSYNICEPITILNSPEDVSVKKSSFLQEKLNVTKDQKIFLYFGMIEPGRGIELLLKTFESMADFRSVMVFVGYGTLENLISQSQNYKKNIFFIPAVPKSEIPMIASSADVGICLISPTCLSYEYCMPNKLFECLASGLPVIVSPCISLGEFVTENQVGFVLRDLTPLALLQEINNIVDLDLQPIKTRAISVAEKNSWAVQAQKLTSAYLAIFNQEGNK